MTLTLSIIVGLVLNFVSASVQAEEARASQYITSCRYEHPLSTYDGCNAKSSSGYFAYSCAVEEALSQCRSDYNIDCVVTAVTYRSIVSQEFIGYKACEASVRVRGYRIK